MMEQAVVNVHGEDQQKIKGGGDCNGGSHAPTMENEVVNAAAVGGKIHADVTGDSVGGSDAVAADGDSAASDLVAVIDDNGDRGAGAEGLKADDGESQVTVLKVAEAESDHDAVLINNKENEGTNSSSVSNGTAKEEIREKEISNGTISVDGENADSGSVTILDVSGDMDVADVTVVDTGVKDVNKIIDHDHEIESCVAGAEDVQNGLADRELNEQAVENEIHGDDDNGGTAITDSNGAVDAQSGVEDEIHGDGVTTFTDANGPVDVQSSVEDEIHGDADGVTVTDANDPVDVQNGVEDEIHGDADGGTAITDSNGAVDAQSGVEDEIHGDGVTTFTDANGPVDVQSSVEDEIHGDADGVTVTDANDPVDVQNGVEDEIHGDADGGTAITDSNGAFDAQSGVEDEIHGDGVTTVTDANGPVDVQNGVEDEIHGDADGVTVTDANGPVDVQNGVEDEIHGDANGVGITDANGEVGVHSSSVENEIHGDSNEVIVTDANVEVGVQNSVENEIHDDVDGVDVAGAAEVLGDEKDVVTVLEGVADENKSHGEEVESLAVEHGLVVESDVPVVVDGVSATDVEECADDGDQMPSGEKAQIESVNSGGGDDKDGKTVVQERSEAVSDTDVDKSLEYENIVSTDVSDEKDIVTNESQDGESESVVADVQNGEDTSLSECAEKNVVSVDADGVSATSDVKECADEFDQNGSERAQIESVTNVDVERSVVVAEVQNGLAEPELSDCTKEKKVPVEGQVGSKPEISEETIHELVLEGEKLSALTRTDMAADDNVVSDMNGNEVESKAEPSADKSDMKNIAEESKAEPSNNAVESEGEPFANMSDMKNNVLKSETEPSVQGEISVEGEGSNHGEGDKIPTLEGSTADSFDGQNVGSEEVKRPFYYLIRLPRYDDDENIQEQINNALKQVDEKTELRGKIRAEINSRKDICNECLQDYRAAKSAEQTARDLFKSKRQEMESVKSTMNRLNNAISVGDIDNKIRNMEHMIQHETLPLNEEKQLIRQIKQLKQNRGELSSIIGKQDQSQQSKDESDSIEEHSKRSFLLKKEFELLKSNLQKVETATKAAKKKYDDEWDKLRELQGRFNVADNIRQEAYTKLRALKSQLHEKRKYFWEYKGAVTKGQELAADGKKEELQCFCIDQVERIMELWNKDDEFRRDYIRCNTRSTLRRLQTLDGRALGPNEQPPVIPNAAFTERASKNNSEIMQSMPEQEKKLTSTESVDIKDEPVPKVVVQKTERSQTTKAIKPVKPAPLEKSSVAVSRWGDEPDEPEDTIEEPVRTKEEEELILKAEKARKEDEAAKLKEKRRLEEIEKAKEAMERKKRNAEKAQQRAILKAQKEADQKEKEREKKARKKERRKAATTDNAENTEQEPAPTSETLTRSTEEIDQSEKPVEVTKRQQKPSQFTKQTKSKSVPLPLRNRGKRRIQPWMWWALIAVLIVVAMFYMAITAL